MKMNVLAIAVLAAGLTTPAFAQIPVGTKVGEVTTPVAPGGYDSGGRRDPFMSLLVSKRAPVGAPTATGRPVTGLTSFALADVQVTGIVTVGKEKMALLQGPNRTSFVAHLKDKIMDASIKSIDEQGVVFVEFTEPGNSARPQEVRKALRPAGEIR